MGSWLIPQFFSYFKQLALKRALLLTLDVMFAKIAYGKNCFAVTFTALHRRHRF
jgi:hypothetical protein